MSDDGGSPHASSNGPLPEGLSSSLPRLQSGPSPLTPHKDSYSPFKSHRLHSSQTPSPSPSSPTSPSTRPQVPEVLKGKVGVNTGDTSSSGFPGRDPRYRGGSDGSPLEGSESKDQRHTHTHVHTHTKPPPSHTRQRREGGASQRRFEDTPLSVSRLGVESPFRAGPTTQVTAGVPPRLRRRPLPYRGRRAEDPRVRLSLQVFNSPYKHTLKYGPPHESIGGRVN